jgi:hypothetical protein
MPMTTTDTRVELRRATKRYLIGSTEVMALDRAMSALAWVGLSDPDPTTNRDRINVAVSVQGTWVSITGHPFITTV